MKRFSKFLVPLLALALALAGCAEDGEPTPDTGATPTTPTSTTPTTPTGETPGEGEGENETPEELPPLDCASTDAGNATVGERAGYPELAYALGGASGDDPCDAFQGPSNATAGWTAVTLENVGGGMFILPILRLDEGRTYEEFLAAAAESQEPPAWAVPVGGVGGATPGSSGTVLLDLAEGTYVLMAVDVGSPAPRALLRPLAVAAGEGEPVAAPEATLEIVLEDFAYVVPENITAGSYVVRFTNNGTQPHEAPLVQLIGNATMQEFLAFAGGQVQGPPPATLEGGVNVLAPGESAYALVDLVEGNYGLVCFVSSPEHEGAPHFALGMLASFSVE
jgi:hypothetical protein